MEKQINNKYIDELFGIKILDDIKKYTKKKNTKPSIYNFYYLGTYRGKRYTTQNMNFLGGKKPMKFIKKNTFDGFFLHADNNSKITKIDAFKKLKSINPTLKELVSKYKDPLDKKICKHFDLAKSEFITKYYGSDYEMEYHTLVSSQYRFEINKIPMILGTNMENMPEIKTANFFFSLQTEKIWKGQYIQDSGFSEVKNKLGYTHNQAKQKYNKELLNVNPLESTSNHISLALLTGSPKKLNRKGNFLFGYVFAVACKFIKLTQKKESTGKEMFENANKIVPSVLINKLGYTHNQAKQKCNKELLNVDPQKRMNKEIFSGFAAGEKDFLDFFNDAPGFFPGRSILKKYSNPKKWKNDLIDDYTGEYNKKGQAHGKGTLKLEDGIFEGYLKNGLMNKGKITHNNGCIYEGSFKDGYKHGYGEFIHPKTIKKYDGIIYKGIWKKGLPEGKGQEIFPRADHRYEGQFKAGKYNGKGTFYFSKKSKQKYIGLFKDGKQHGKGIFFFRDGTKYVGLFKDDNKHGKGTMIYKEGGRVSGTWKNDKRIGIFKFAFTKSDVEFVKYKNGKMV